MVGTLPVAPVQLPIFRNRTYIRFTNLDNSLSDVSGSLTGLIGFPQYKSLQTIAEESAINFTPQCNGFVSLITDSGIVKNVGIHINGKFAMNVTNSIMFPIRRGDVITSTSTVRSAYFYPSE